MSVSDEQMRDAAKQRRAKRQTDEATVTELHRRRLTDDGNAYRLIDLHGDDLRYVPGVGWHGWDGTRWLHDVNGEVVRRARDLVHLLHTEADRHSDEATAKVLKQHARSSSSRRGIEALLWIARSDPRVLVDVAQLDANPFVLNALNGTIDLRTGELHPHDRADLIARRVAVVYDPDAKAPTWTRFTERVLPDEDVRDYVQRTTGAAASGGNLDELLHVLHGSGANGKSKFVRTIAAALGDYAATAGAELLLAGQRRSGGQPELVRLRGARLLVVGETDEGSQLDAARVKALTGGDVISCRLLYANEVVEFVPVFSPWLVTNHKPAIPEQSEAIWRRVRLVPFTVTIPRNERDPALQGKLLAELPGVLAWIVEGARRYLNEGLTAPSTVEHATAGYRADEDAVGRFITECCEVGPVFSVSATDLYRSWRHWCITNGEDHGSQTAFGRRLSELRDDAGQPRFPSRATRTKRLRDGLRLLDDQPSGGLA